MAKHELDFMICCQPIKLDYNIIISRHYTAALHRAKASKEIQVSRYCIPFHHGNAPSLKEMAGVGGGLIGEFFVGSVEAT